MSEIIKVVGVDPSLRKTGFGAVSFNTETEKFSVDSCGVLLNPQKFTGTNAIKNMLEMLEDLRDTNPFGEYNDGVIESPPVVFNPKFPSSSLLPIAHISGAAAILFGLDKIELIYPAQWNRSKAKAKTHDKTQDVLGEARTWGYFNKVTDNHLEHVLDAVSMAFWYLKKKYIEETL